MEYLSRKGAAFTAKNVRDDPAAMKEMIEGGFMSTPVIRIDGHTITGFDRAKIDAALGEA
jgi:glutaredoxin